MYCWRRNCYRKLNVQSGFSFFKPRLTEDDEKSQSSVHRNSVFIIIRHKIDWSHCTELVSPKSYLLNTHIESDLTFFNSVLSSCLIPKKKKEVQYGKENIKLVKDLWMIHGRWYFVEWQSAPCVILHVSETSFWRIQTSRRTVNGQHTGGRSFEEVWNTETKWQSYLFI